MNSVSAGQQEFRAHLDNYDAWIAIRWEKFSELMRQIVLETRHDMIMQLQILQLQEFDYE